MSKITNYMVDEKVTIVKYPEIPEFKVTMAFLSRDQLVKIRNKCTTKKYDKRSRQYEEDVDNDKFLKLYTKNVIKGWVGLKVKHLSKLLPVDLSKATNLEESIDFSDEEAYDLVKNSSEFDQFLTDTLNDLENFEEEDKEEEAKN